MGVPAFFGWLTRKYPGILERCIEKTETTSNGSEKQPTDSASNYASQASQINITVPIAEGVALKEEDVSVEIIQHEFDNLYIDMNGIIHNVSHGDVAEGPRTDESVRANLFNKLDQLMSFVRPKSVLFLAIDGVAPRAKMNQQRSRRFKSSRDAKEEIAKLKEEWIAAHSESEPFPEITHWDSNQISPGTEFMQKISIYVQEWVKMRLESDGTSKHLKVIFSDCAVPGEGEHKILDFIRFNRQSPDYNPFTRHCFYGPDADLLFLGLTLHEPYFTVLREQDGSGLRRLVEPFNAVPSTAVFIGKIPSSVNEEYLRLICSKFGKVEEVVIAKDVVSGKPRGHAFVRFDSIEAAAKLALSTVRLNKEKTLFTKFETLENMEREKGRLQLLSSVRDTVRVNFLPYSMTETELGQLMEQHFGKVLEVRIITDKDLKSKGFGYVRFEKEESALNSTKEQIQVGARSLKMDIANRKRSPDNNSADASSSTVDTVDVAHNPGLRNERITLFLTETGRFENAIAYRYLDANDWDVATAVASFKAGDPLPEFKYEPEEEEKASNAPAEADPSFSTPVAAPEVADAVDGDEVDDEANGEEGGKKSRKIHVFVHIHIMQEYLQNEFEHAFAPTNTPFDLERVIDDFVLICMMCGNDFLPHIPMLDIRKGAIDILLYVYKMVFPSMGGYIVEPGKIHFDRLALFLSEIVSAEANFMIRRFAYDDEKKSRQEARAAAAAQGLPDPTLNLDGIPASAKAVADMYAPLISTADAALWKQRYYKETFNLPVLEQSFVDQVASKFVEGLFWVYSYYYYGVDNSSWSWYYPYHFAPLMGDVHSILQRAFKGKTEIKIDIGHPLRPLEQLLAVLPPASAPILPEAFRPLVLSPDSPIIEYYPLDFEVFNEPGRPSWLAVSILNFIDIDRLLKAAKSVEANLTDEEKFRNTNQDAPMLVLRKDDALVREFFSQLKDATSSVAIRGPNAPFTADITFGDAQDRFSGLTGETLALCYCRSVSGTHLPLRVGMLAEAKNVQVFKVLCKDELNKSLPKKKQYSYINRPAHLASTSSPVKSASVMETGGPALIESVLNLTKCECLNDKKNHDWKQAFGSLRSSEDAYLESDADAQMLLHLEFLVPVKLSTISLATPKDKIKQGPRSVKLFVNHPGLDFDSVESMKSDQGFNIHEDELLTEKAIRLTATRFSAVHHLTIFFQSNQTDADTTVVSRIAFDGPVPPKPQEPVSK